MVDFCLIDDDDDDDDDDDVDDDDDDDDESKSKAASDVFKTLFGSVRYLGVVLRIWLVSVHS